MIYKDFKLGENGRRPRPNGLVFSAGKCAGPIPAKNRTSCGKSIRTPNNMDKQLFSARSAYFLKPIGGFNFPAKSPLLKRETRPFSPKKMNAIFTRIKEIFRAFSTQMVGANLNGGCSLRSRPREVHPRL